MSDSYWGSFVKSLEAWGIRDPPEVEDYETRLRSLHQRSMLEIFTPQWRRKAAAAEKDADRKRAAADVLGYLQQVDSQSMRSQALFPVCRFPVQDRAKLGQIMCPAKPKAGGEAVEDCMDPLDAVPSLLLCTRKLRKSAPESGGHRVGETFEFHSEDLWVRGVATGASHVEVQAGGALPPRAEAPRHSAPFCDWCAGKLGK
eukprot:TRINITY_DN56475_c0_g1_i1.p2 TRINITY_DN56475_c0_g1~~TRINITY_DN56475_c0_g1_i1.p2  ORF type:complete len:201 (+),score=39.35 TRINITY_DN56475_c0_g1_i1:80-682(+)